MPKWLNMKEVLKNNPGVDREKLKEASKLFEELKKLGLTRKGYRLHTRSLGPAESDTEDSRTVYLRTE